MKKIFLLVFALVLTGAGCFSASSSGGSDGGIFQTTDAGENWVQTILVPTAAGIGTLGSANVLDMEMDPQDDDFLYVATRSNGMLYSEDAGISWRQPRRDALTDGLVRDIAVDPTDVCTVYVTKGSRLYGTDDCMRTFDSEVYVETRSGVEVMRVAVDWYDREVIWIGLTNGDILKSEDAGNTWKTSLKTGDQISDFLISNTDSRQVLVSTFDNGIFKTTDRGENWDGIEDKLTELNKANEVFLMVQTDDSSTVLTSTTYGILRSEDFGSTWETISLVTSPGQVEIRALAVAPDSASTIYYAANTTFYYSADSGSTWTTERIPTTRQPRVMLVDPEDSSVLYIGVATPVE